MDIKGRQIFSCDDQPIDEFETSQNEVFVSARDRIEAAGVDSGAHGHGGESSGAEQRGTNAE